MRCSNASHKPLVHTTAKCVVLVQVVTMGVEDAAIVVAACALASTVWKLHVASRVASDAFIEITVPEASKKHSNTTQQQRCKTILFQSMPQLERKGVVVVVVMKEGTFTFGAWTGKWCTWHRLLLLLTLGLLRAGN